MTGEGLRQTPEQEAANRRLFLARLVSALAPDTYSGDGHTVRGQTPTYGPFKLTDYFVSQLKQCEGLPSPELRAALLAEPDPRPCLSIERLNPVQKEQGFPVGYFVVHPEDLKPESMLAHKLLPKVPEGFEGPGVFRTDEGLTVSFIADPLSEPMLGEIYDSLAVKS